MKRSLIVLALIGGFLLLSNLTFAQDTQPASGNGSTTTNQVASGTQGDSYPADWSDGFGNSTSSGNGSTTTNQAGSGTQGDSYPADWSDKATSNSSW
jgi:hypothetical protein